MEPPYREGDYVAPDGALVKVRWLDHGAWGAIVVRADSATAGTLSAELWAALRPAPPGFVPTCRGDALATLAGAAKR